MFNIVYNTLQMTQPNPIDATESQLDAAPAPKCYRKGVFIGAYVPKHIRRKLKARAAAEDRSVAYVLTRILEQAMDESPAAVGTVVSGPHQP